MGPALIAVAESACTAKQEGSAFKVLGANEADDFAAIAARLIPTTDTPGATEAGVIYFIDNALAAEPGGQFNEVRAGLADFNSALNTAHPDAEQFSSLHEDDQDAFLRTQESSKFFELTWALTMFGFFAMEKHGGNKDHISWDLIEFDGNHGPWQYPFGYYDAQVHGETNHRE